MDSIVTTTQREDSFIVDGPGPVSDKPASSTNFYVASYKSTREDDEEEEQVEETIELMEETDDEDQEQQQPKQDGNEGQEQKGVGAVPVEDEGTSFAVRRTEFAKFDRPIPPIPLPTTPKEIKAALLKCGWQKEEFDYYKMKRILPPDDLVPYRKRILQLADATSMKPTADVFGVSSATLYLWKRAKPSNDRSSDCVNDEIDSTTDQPKETPTPTPKISREKRITIENRQSPVAALANSVESLGTLVSDILTRLSKLEKEVNASKFARPNQKRRRNDSSDEESESSDEESSKKRKDKKKVSQLLFQEVLSQLVKAKNKNKRLKEATKERDDRWMYVPKGTKQYPITDLDQDDIETWVTCARCKKWRKLVGSAAVPTTSKWYCEMNDDPRFNSCDHPEEKGRGYRSSSSSSSSSASNNANSATSSSSASSASSSS